MRLKRLTGKPAAVFDYSHVGVHYNQTSLPNYLSAVQSPHCTSNFGRTNFTNKQLTELEKVADSTQKILI
jgi:hypothetical protein